MTREYPRRQRKQASGHTGKLLTWSSVSFLIGYLVAHVYDVNKIGNIAQEQFFPHRTSSQPIVAEKPQEPPKPKFEFYTLLSKDDKARAERSHRYRPQDVQPSQLAQIQARTQDSKAAQTNNALAQQAAVMASSATDAKALQERIAPAVEAAPTQAVVEAKPVSLPTPESFKERLGEHEAALPKPNLPMQTMPVAQKPSQPEPIKKPLFAKDAYTVQVAAFNRLADAEKMKNTLGQRGYRALIAPLPQGSVTWYRVQVGPFPNVASAENARMQLERYAHLRGMIRKMDA